MISENSMSPEMYNFDIFPKVFLAKVPQKIVIRPIGVHCAFTSGDGYDIRIVGLNCGRDDVYPDSAYTAHEHAVADESGALTFSHTFPSEQEYYVEVHSDNTEDVQRIRNGNYTSVKRIFPMNLKRQTLAVRLSVYALEEDMKGRYPYMGDLHMHTCRSDGSEDPKIVAANYRRYGYDFMVISDHRRYYPSLDAMRFYKPLGIKFNIVPGEEIHFPGNDVHIVNFGSDFSVNGLWADSMQNKERGNNPLERSVSGKCPEVMSADELNSQFDKIESELENDFNSRGKDEEYRYLSEHPSIKRSYAMCLWIFDKIREGNGLAIFPHPCWRYPEYQLPARYAELILSEHPFDAFEVLGGEDYYEHNGFQTAMYYEQLARGNKLPIVGSTDSHGSTEHNPTSSICETMVFAMSNSRDDLVSAIKDCYSVAVDTIDKNYRIVGSLRLQQYASFLMKNYFPLHNRLCMIEGEYMRQYAAGDKKSGERLCMIRDDVPDVMKKYINL